MARIRGTSSDDLFNSLNLGDSSNSVYGRGGNDMLVWDYGDHAKNTYFHGGGGSATTSVESFLALSQQDTSMDNPSIQLFSTTKQSGAPKGDVFVIRFADYNEFQDFLTEQGYNSADAFYADLAALQPSLGRSTTVDLSDILGSDVSLKRVEHIGVVIDNKWTVTTSNDVVDPNDGLISLREAIQYVNENPDQEWVIDFAQGITEIDLLLQDSTNSEDSIGTDNLIGDLDLVNANVTILGNGVSIDAAGLIVNPEDGDVLDRVLHIADSQVSIEGLTFTGGYSYHHGGGVYVANSVVDIVDSTFVGNSAGVVVDVGSGLVHTGRGGALSVDANSVVSVEDSEFSGNYALGVGGAIAVSSDSQLTIRDSDVSENHVGSYGGGFYNAGSLILDNVLTFGNTTDEMFPANNPFSENSYQHIQNSSVTDYYASAGEDVFFFDLVDFVTNDTHYTVHDFNPDEDLVNLFPNYHVTDSFTVAQAGTDVVTLDFTGDGDAEITLVGVGLDVDDIRFTSPFTYTGTENLVASHEPILLF